MDTTSGQTFPFAEIQRICVQTIQIGNEMPTYDGSLDSMMRHTQFSRIAYTYRGRAEARRKIRASRCIAS